MSANAEKQDLRIKKTRWALKDALFSLLLRRRFDKITVNDLCEEAVVSRTAFYTHFEDKYALLRFSLEEIKKDIEDYERDHTDSENVTNMNEYIQQNGKLLKNLIDESNTELMNILIGLIAKDVSKRICVDENLSPYDHALVNFCAGGFANLLLWQLKNNFPMESGDFGEYVNRILKTLKDSRG
jgi:AcrR family transcriptional regulator